jgi:uncharacterized protein YbbC (DUF1343 family)
LNKKCYVIDLRKDKYLKEHPREINLDWLLAMWSKLKKTDFFDDNFNFHAGNAELQNQIKSGISIEEIRNTWKKDLDAFKTIRKKYLLYPDF